MRILMLLSFALLFSCTDAEMSSLEAYGSAAKIACYSGGEEFYKGESTGRISSTENSDGWEFKEKDTGDFIRVSGACVIRN